MRNVGLSCFAIAAAYAFAIGCGSADEHPLGGPYGGSGNATDPTHGGSPNGATDDDSGAPSGDDTSNPPPEDDSGTVTPPPPGVDSGTTPPPPPNGHDSGTTPPPPAPDSGTTPPPQSAPTWSSIFSAYFASGTPGGCPSCHSQTSSASKMYSWMSQKGYISGTSSSITNTSRSDISWFGGSMPPSGPRSEPTAVSQMKAWVAAGALNN